MKSINLDEHEFLKWLIIGMFFILLLTGIGVIVNTIGNLLFPIWWNEPVSSFMVFISLLLFLVLLLLSLRNRKIKNIE